MGWTTPKTNWTKTDFFNLSDYNRIKNNLPIMSNVFYCKFKVFRG